MTTQSEHFVPKRHDRPSPREVQEFHTNADVDGSPKALHHTLGPGPNQASPGNHSHDAGASTALSGYSVSTHNHDPAYSAISHVHTALYLPNNVAWIAPTLLNSWAAYGSGHRNPGYRLVGDIVELRGLVRNGTAAPSIIFNVPAAYRPNAQEIFMQTSNTGSARVDILPAGDVTVQAYIGTGSNAFVSLAGMRWSVL
jgi:hypothetical protein